MPTDPTPTPTPRAVCGKRVTRSNGDWLPCTLPEGHPVFRDTGCAVIWGGNPEPTWNPRDIERRKNVERRADLAALRATAGEWQTPTMWWNTDGECWYEEKSGALDDLDCGKVYEIETARKLPSLFVVNDYDEAEDEYRAHEFATKEEADAFLAARTPTPEGQG